MTESKETIELEGPRSQASRDPLASRDGGDKFEPEYPSGWKLCLIAFALCLSVFLMSLDNSIITTAIPRITEEFRSVDDIGWYGSAYLLTTSSLQLPFGKLYSFLSIKWVFLSAMAVFEIGSAVCGSAPNSVALIVGRAVAGCGSAGLLSGALLILANSVPLSRRPIFTGMLGSMYGISSIAGPLLGGAFTDHVTWRWCFYINLPLGAMTFIIITIFFKEPHRPNVAKSNLPFAKRIKELDPIGNLIFMPAVICILLALQWGGVTYTWSNGRIIALFVLAGVLLILFVIVQIRGSDHATIPPRIIKQRSVWASAAFEFALGSSFFIFVYYLPIWFQAIQGVSAVDSGLRNLPMLIGNMVGALGSGVAVTALGYYAPFMIISTILVSIGGGLLTLFNPATPSGQWIGYQALLGAGIGIGLQQPLLAVQAVLDIEDVPTATALMVFSQTLGGAIFVSVAETVFTNKLVQELTSRVPGLNPVVVLDAGATSLGSIVPAQNVAAVILSYSNGITTTFIVATALGAVSMVGSAFVEWKSVKGQKVEAGFA